jgi:hypothetical protein
VFFFGTRMFATHVVSFFFYCTLVPICIFLPEARPLASFSLNFLARHICSGSGVDAHRVGWS